MTPMKRTAKLIVSLVCFGTTTFHVVGQPIDPRECFRGVQFNQFWDTLSQWEERKPLEKKNYDEEFRQQIKELGEAHDAKWIEDRLNIWDQELPQVVLPSLKFAPEAKTLLASLYSENAKTFFETTPSLRRTRILESRIYLVSYLAEKKAKDEKDEEIKASHVLPVMSRAWTGLWPLCPRAKKR